jgi:hypothetical protein
MTTTQAQSIREQWWSADRFEVRQEAILVNSISRDRHGWRIHAEVQLEIRLEDGTLIESFETHILKAKEGSA